MVLVPPEPPADLSLFARLLWAMAQAPRRRSPEPGDLSGPYDEWFDGGAVVYTTDFNRFTFADGSEAWLSTHSLHLQGGVRLPGGVDVLFEEQRKAAGPDVCCVCGQVLAPGTTMVVTPRGAAHAGCVPG